MRKMDYKTGQQRPLKANKRSKVKTFEHFNPTLAFLQRISVRKQLHLRVMRRTLTWLRACQKMICFRATIRNLRLKRVGMLKLSRRPSKRQNRRRKRGSRSKNSRSKSRRTCLLEFLPQVLTRLSKSCKPSNIARIKYSRNYCKVNETKKLQSFCRLSAI